ncbi:unnamed protein product, partial [Darwinula stevensoni]
PCDECNKLYSDLEKEERLRESYVILKQKNEDYLKKPDVPAGAAIKVRKLAELLLPLSRVKEERELRDMPEGEEKTAFLAKVEKKKLKQSQMRAQQIFHWVYQRYVVEWDLMTDLAKDLREWLKSNIQIFRLEETYAKQSQDGTFKFLWKLHDAKTIESVIIPAALREKIGDEVIDALEDGKRYSGVETNKAGLNQDLNEDSWARLTACISS